MTISQNLKEGLIIVGIVVVGALILLPRKRGIGMPEKAEDEKVNNVKNARVVLDAYLNAVEAGESKANLDKLNKMFVEEYKLKVYRNKSGNYVARTMDGKDILMVK